MIIIVIANRIAKRAKNFVLCNTARERVSLKMQSRSNWTNDRSLARWCFSFCPSSF